LLVHLFAGLEYKILGIFGPLLKILFISVFSLAIGLHIPTEHGYNQTEV
jgi:hypothetical protein